MLLLFYPLHFTHDSFPTLLSGIPFPDHDMYAIPISLLQLIPNHLQKPIKEVLPGTFAPGSSLFLFYLRTTRL